MDKWQIMRYEVSRSFAKRLVQEAAMQETNWFVAHHLWMRYILQHEEAQQLIDRMCAAPLVIRYHEDDEIIHTDLHPFCDDPSCGCHDDVELIQEHLEHPFDEGLLTEDEAVHLFYGKQV